MHFIIRLFPEITIKSPSIRKRWSRKLADNMRILARRIYEQSSVVLEWDRILLRVKTDDEAIEAQVVRMLQCTPGIAHFSKVSAHEFATVHDIYEHCLRAWVDKLSGKRFCVRVKRSGQHDFSSLDVERYVGGGLLQHTDNAGVSLSEPDITVIIEIKDQVCYIVESRVEGLGGFPMGTQDEVVSLVSGGFDSTVASYMLMRRGMKTHFCFFQLGGREHELAVKEVAYYLWSTFSSSHRVKFVSVPFEGVVEQILTQVSPANMGVALKRMMLRAAERVAARMRAPALVTGEAISQVSSQTLHNLRLIDQASQALVLRPLITMDKPDIIALARAIGTEAFSAAIPEYCGVISIKPSAEVNAATLAEEEAALDMGVLDRALAASRAMNIDDVMIDKARKSPEPESIGTLGEHDRVIDIRHSDERELKPLPLSEDQLICIPFYSLNARAAELDPAFRYALYCEKGVMSQLHAAHLLDQGYTQFVVYRPNSDD